MGCAETTDGRPADQRLTADALVVGAGPAGLRAALDLAERGRDVLLVEQNPAPGGILRLLDHQFPSDHCGFCRMLPRFRRDAGGQFCLKRGFVHERVALLTRTRVESLDGAPGAFKASLNRQNPGVDPALCLACGACEAACPETTPDPDQSGLIRRKAIFAPWPGGRSRPRVIDWAACTRCGACRDACPSGAVHLDDRTETIAVTGIKAAVWAAGGELFHPGERDLYGWGVLPGVVTSDGFERILSPSGPTGGRLVRLEDEAPVNKAAWVQCVGSRDVMIGADHCSSACCMFALKEALLAKKANPDLDAAVLYMDMRTFGRDYQRYRDRAEAAGVRLIRTRVHSLDPGDDGRVRIRYMSGNGPAAEDFDLAVLSTGRTPNPPRPDWLALDGVFELESARVLADLDQAVIGGSDAAVRAAEYMGSPVASESTEAEDRRLAELEQTVSRTAVVVVTGSGGAGRNLDWTDALGRVGRRGRVAAAARVEDGWTSSARNEIAEIVRSAQANRLVIGAALRPPDWDWLTNLAAAVHLPPAAFDVVDLRSVVERAPADAGASAAAELGAAVGRLTRRTFEPPSLRQVTRRVLIVGGGPAGMSAALTVARAGLDAVLVEQESRLGRSLDRAATAAARSLAESLPAEVSPHPNIDVQTDSRLTGLTGTAGRFEAEVTGPAGPQRVTAGAVIVATGVRRAEVDVFGLEASDRVLTVGDLEDRIAEDSRTPRRVVLVLCAGSRQEPRNYCGRYCCLGALETAGRMVDRYPDARITVFYRDVMTYGASEAVYTRVRSKGVLFVPYDVDRPPRIQPQADHVAVSAYDPVMGEDKNIAADWVGLAVGPEPKPSGPLAELLGVDRTGDGFWQEADYKWRPVETMREGVLVCGAGRAPMRADEAAAEGRAAAGRALALLDQNLVRASLQTAKVRASLCSLCRACVQACPFAARWVDQDAGCVQVDPTLCQGCGMCASVCPNQATRIGQFEGEAMIEALETVLME